MAHKAEHAAEQVNAVLPAGGAVAEAVADKGYHSNETMVALADLENNAK